MNDRYDIEMMNDSDIRTVPRREFPFLLRQISSLPKTLDIIGDMPPDDMKFLCVVGARRHSHYGRDACASLIAGLRGYPVVIVSGLAIGIDSIAHEAAIAAGLKTVAFPGSGLSAKMLYPTSRRALAQAIIDSGGALASPFKRDDPAAPWFFPARNRLMAGMCHATLIVEARADSGTMITANAALEFGRDVLAVPGSIFSEMSHGPNALFSHGGAAVSSSRDILEMLGLMEPLGTEPAGQASLFSKKAPTSTETAPQPELSTLHRRILDALDMAADETNSSARSASTLIGQLGISAADFAVATAELELLGRIEIRGGSLYISRRRFATSKDIV